MNILGFVGLFTLLHSLILLKNPFSNFFFMGSNSISLLLVIAFTVPTTFYARIDR